jgi:hypothetical protein
MPMHAAAADARVQQQRITGPTKSTLHTSSNGVFELIQNKARSQKDKVVSRDSPESRAAEGQPSPPDAT